MHIKMCHQQGGILTISLFLTGMMIAEYISMHFLGLKFVHSAPGCHQFHFSWFSLVLGSTCSLETLLWGRTSWLIKTCSKCSNHKKKKTFQKISVTFPYNLE